MRELVKLHESAIIRVMDILILQKADDGSVMAQELGDLGDSDELVALEGQLVQTLAEDDVENLAAAMDPGSVAGVLVYENTWAAPFASAMRRAGGQLIADAGFRSRPSSPRSKPTRRSNQKESEMPLGPGRRGVGVIGGPVAKVAVVGSGRRARPVARRKGGRRWRRRRPRSVACRQGCGRRCGRYAWSPSLLGSGLGSRPRVSLFGARIGSLTLRRLIPII